VPIRDVTVRFRWDAPKNAPAPAVHAARTDIDLAARPVEGGYDVTLPQLDLFELLTVEGNVTPPATPIRPGGR